MGNCCGKESDGVGGTSSGGGNFKGQGRTLGDGPPRQAAAPLATPASPAKASIPPTVTGPGRTVGEASAGAGGDARTAAAAAAEARASKTGGTDKLSQNLAAQRKAGMKGALADAADENRRLRENDATAEARNWS